MFRNLCTNLFEHERITTTLAKAKEMRPKVVKLMHKATMEDRQRSYFFIRKDLFT